MKVNNLDDVQEWYRDHNVMLAFYKLYKCGECKYQNICAGISKVEVRETCNNFIPASGEENNNSSVWFEMSYHTYGIRKENKSAHSVAEVK